MGCCAPYGAVAAQSLRLSVKFGKMMRHSVKMWGTSAGILPRNAGRVQDNPTRSGPSYTPSYTRNGQCGQGISRDGVGCVGDSGKIFVGRWDSVRVLPWFLEIPRQFPTGLWCFPAVPRHCPPGLRCFDMVSRCFPAGFGRVSGNMPAGFISETCAMVGKSARMAWKSVVCTGNGVGWAWFGTEWVQSGTGTAWESRGMRWGRRGVGWKMG